ncbi:ATP-binding protein [Nocardioides convexus]|uniref:sensor histidine kinase n=1 Tax=Nocardioides convexus TaxID=2712224 RepID=UPI0024184379|nr:ATP-binding protein [Nocardioides convexus]
MLSIRQSTADFADESGAQMRNSAEYVAALPQVRDQAQAARDGGLSASSLPRALEIYVVYGVDFYEASDVSIVSPEGTVLAATQPDLVGERAQTRGQRRAAGPRLVGRHRPRRPPGRRRARADHLGEGRHAARDRDRRGGVPHARRPGSPRPRRTSCSTWGSAPCSVSPGPGWSLASYGARHGDSAPPSLANLADHREALLHAIREGVVGVGTDRRVTAMNDAARTTLGLDGGPDPVGRPVDALGLDPHVVALLADEATDARDALALVGSRVVVFNRGRASAGGRGIGTVTTLRDRTELASLQSQARLEPLHHRHPPRADPRVRQPAAHDLGPGPGWGSTTRSPPSSARSPAAARRSRSTSPSGSPIPPSPPSSSPSTPSPRSAGSSWRSIPAPACRRCRRTWAPTSRPSSATSSTTPSTPPPALPVPPGPWSSLWLHADAGAVHLRVRDTGPGIAPEQREAVFVRGFSTKEAVPGGRGIGLALVRLICTQRGGEVVVDDAEEAGGGGAEFRVVLPLSAELRKDAGS